MDACCVYARMLISMRTSEQVMTNTWYEVQL